MALVSRVEPTAYQGRFDILTMMADQTTTFTALNKLARYYYYHYSTESAVLKVFSDIVDALDSDSLVLLSLLHLSTAFDTVDHDSLRQRLTSSFGIRAKTLH